MISDLLSPSRQHRLRVMYHLHLFHHWGLQDTDNMDLQVIKGLGLWCLTPLSTIFQLYHGGNQITNTCVIVKNINLIHILQKSKSESIEEKFIYSLKVQNIFNQVILIK